MQTVTRRPNLAGTWRTTLVHALEMALNFARRCELTVARAEAPGSRVDAMRRWERFMRAARYAAKRLKVNVPYLMA